MEPCGGQAYADDLVILCCGTRAGLRGPMTSVLRMTDNWCQAVGLKINPTKAKLMLFSHKRNKETRPEIKLSDTVLNYSQTVKYLGIYLDTKLSWREHILCRARKAVCAGGPSVVPEV